MNMNPHPGEKKGGGGGGRGGALPLKDPFALIIQLSQRQVLLQS